MADIKCIDPDLKHKAKVAAYLKGQLLKDFVNEAIKEKLDKQ